MNSFISIANQIVFQMKDIVKKNLNFISIEGIIIASTDSTRVGTYHEAGKIVYQMKKDIIVKEDGEYIGVKKGINMPVKFNGEIVGIIGISGEIDEVLSYAEIIKQMTEILIKEAYINYEKESKRQRLENLIFGDNPIKMPINKARIIICDYEVDTFDKLNLCISSKEMAIKSTNLIVTLLLDRTRDEIEKIISSCNIKNCGIGTCRIHEATVKNSYAEALKALVWSKKIGKRISYYEDVKLAPIYDDISNIVRTKFCDNIFKDMCEEEIHEFYDLYRCYQDTNGSLMKMSEQLYLHKNTIQYKLLKLYKLTGLDIRNYSDFSVLKTAFDLYVCYRD